MKVQNIIVSIASVVFCGITVFRTIRYGSNDIWIIHLLCGPALWQAITASLILIQSKIIIFCLA